jgi:ubiquinone/menaquinone biosynthesis C-methylase UbiE
MSAPENVDAKVAAGFGDEWTRFDQSQLSADDKRRIFDEYFHLFPWERIDKRSVGADFGCGSGRWATLVAPRVGKLFCVDASAAALAVSRRNLAEQTNCEFIESSIDVVPLASDSLDFGYSLGVLHHMPDTAAGLASCVKRLKSGAPFLVYLYYSFDNKPLAYRWLWRASEAIRFVVSRSPYWLRYWLSQVFAMLVYWPLARLSKLLERSGLQVGNLPLSYYRDKPFYVMRTDALDRFGTRLEQRFSRAEIKTMMEQAGLRDISFSERTPYWCAVGYKRDAG